MVWLHGGGFYAGSSIEQIAYDGTNLSQFGDVVVVSLNHRLNLLGYLNLSEYGEKYWNSGNVGNADIVAALRWIRDNIEAFGGDPQNVTLFGQSGGGMKIWTLMQTPEADGLYHKAIIQSGVLEDFIDEENTDAKPLIRAMLQELNMEESDIEKWEDMPYRELADAYNKVSDKVLAEGGLYRRTSDSELLLHGGSLKNWIFGICPKGAGVNRKCVRRDGICTRADRKESNDTRGIDQDCRKTIW